MSYQLRRSHCHITTAQARQLAQRFLNLQSHILMHLHRRWTQFDHITSVMTAYGAPYEIRAVQPSEIEGGANALNMTQVPWIATDRRLTCSRAQVQMQHAEAKLVQTG